MRAGEVRRQAARTLDFGQPVAIMLLAILHYIPDLDEARRIVARLVDAVPSGSHLLDPGVVKVTEWRPASAVEAESPTSLWGGVARKP